MTKKELSYFELLKDTLHIGYNVDCSFYEYPYDDVTDIDKGIRKMMWEGFDYHFNANVHLINRHANEILIISSNLGFYNIVFYLPSNKEPDKVAIGPFRNEVTPPSYFEQIIQSASIPHSKIFETENVFRQLPKADPDVIAAISRRILSDAFPTLKNAKCYTLEFNDERRSINPDFSLINDNFINKANDYRDCLLQLCDAIRQGDIESARICMRNALQAINTDDLTNITVAKSFANTMNAIAFIVLLTTSVNASRAIMLFIQMQLTISNTSNASRLSYIPYDISHKYSLLVKNYGHASYPKKIREIIDYIDLHLSEDLSLSALAQKFNYHPASLSSSFKKETDTSLTTYVKQTRIREAIRLFNSTNAKISDVALSVGYEDFAYFSRVFKEISGLSPREYNKNNHADQ